MNETVQIIRVKQQPSGLWVITDSLGVKHATKSAWLAAAADRYRDTGAAVSVLSFSGWYYRDLVDIRAIEQVQEAS